MSRYRVRGRRAYREHPPGSIFEAELEPDAEARAIERGDITVLNSSRTRLRPGSWTLPYGWQQITTSGAPPGALSLKGAASNE